jgi:hypothetical protein
VLSIKNGRKLGTGGYDLASYLVGILIFRKFAGDLYEVSLG